MNRIITVALLALGAGLAQAQVKVNGIDLDDLNVDYVELVGYDQGFFSSKVVVVVDYGQRFKLGESQAITGPDGSQQKFTGMMHAINFMSKNGWQYVDAYEVSAPGGGTVYRYLMRRVR